MNFLVVDDMDNMRHSIRAMLKLIGYGENIFEAGNGKEAWNLLDQEEDQIHFVISDWNMPIMTGTELLNRMRADRRFRDIPFLMITAEANKEIVAEAAENDVDAYLTKPFVTVSLEKKIESLIQSATNPEPLAIHLSNARNLEEVGDIDGAIAEARLAADASDRSSRPLRELGRLYL
ncbi:MAG: response regulator, partial [Deltaproteobacteria bacterium]